MLPSCYLDGVCNNSTTQRVSNQAQGVLVHHNGRLLNGCPRRGRKHHPRVGSSWSRSPPSPTATATTTGLTPHTLRPAGPPEPRPPLLTPPNRHACALAGCRRLSPRPHPPPPTPTPSPTPRVDVWRPTLTRGQVPISFLKCVVGRYRCGINKRPFRRLAACTRPPAPHPSMLEVLVSSGRSAGEK